MEDGDLINDETLRPHIHEKKWGEREVKKKMNVAEKKNLILPLLFISV